jgi:hypothetical protein
VIGFSRLDTEDDGVILAGGTANLGANVEIEASGSGVDSASVPVNANRWLALLNGGGGLGEGNYALRAQSGTDDNGGTGNIGIR